MLVKFILYLFIIPFVIWSLEALNFNKIVKNNKPVQAKNLYIIFSLCISYIIVQFIEQLIYFKI